jgi:hypothetical protein
MKLRRTLSLATFALGTLFAQSPVLHASHWTAVASTGTVDESAENFYAFAPNPTTLGYLGGSMSILPVVARYNVTNTSNASGEIAPWNTLELGYFDNANGSVVTAQLFEVDPCTGLRTLICQAQSVNAAASTCVTCTFNAPIDFGNFLYYVEVTITRNNSNLLPTANTLRIF